MNINVQELFATIGQGTYEIKRLNDEVARLSAMSTHLTKERDDARKKVEELEKRLIESEGKVQEVALERDGLRASLATALQQNIVDPVKSKYAKE